MSTPKTTKASMEEVSWADVRQQVKEIAPDIYSVIEKLDLTQNHRIYKVRYPFGAIIIGEDGICNIPNKNGVLTPLTDNSTSKKMKENLDYNWNGIPMSLILSGQVELYVEDALKEIESWSVMKKGVMLASRAVFDHGRSYQLRSFCRMTSGSRALFSLASISDAASFKRLKNYFNLSVDKESTKNDVWPLFAELANSKEFRAVWYSEHLFFGKEWIKQPKNDAWAAFHLVLLERSWKASAYERHAEIVNRIWNLFRRNKKITDYIFQMVKHIIEAGLGNGLLYKPIGNSDIAGPFNAFTDVLLNVYGLKKYAPIIMCADTNFFDDKLTGYISIQKPLKILAKNEYKNLIVTAREIKQVLMSFLNESEKGIIKLDDTPFYDLRSLNFDFYHSDEDINKEFLSSSEIFSDDPVVQKFIKKIPHKEIPFRNDLLRSCIKISRKKS